jgi:hypothetical protein
MESKNKIKENEWLNLLKNAVNEGVEIQVNHRFKYRDKNLGTFLISAKRKNKIELIEEIERLGINFKMHSKNPEHYLEKFILQLSTDKKPNKQRYITRFNIYVLPKYEILKKQTIKKLNQVWKEKFGDIRKWEKPDTVIDKIQKWKDFRYDKKTNPNEKWFDYKKNMGKLYSWAYTRKKDKQKMSLILEHFNKKELSELEKEGF